MTPTVIDSSVPQSWLTLWDRDFTNPAFATAGASAAGAITLAGDAAVIVNPSNNFLKPTSGGVSIVSGVGLQLDTTARTTGPTNDLNHSLGAGVYWSLTAILSAALWPNTQPGPEVLWGELCVAAVFDTSQINANSEGVSVFYANNTTFGLGVSADVTRQSGALAPTACQHGSTGLGFISTSATLAALGLPGAPDVAAVVCGHSGGGSAWGISPGGVMYPTQMYSEDKFAANSIGNAVNTVGGYIRNTGIIGVSVYDSGKTDVQVRIKRMTLWGRNPALRFPFASATQFTITA